jgi:hypothetical protein
MNLPMPTRALNSTAGWAAESKVARRLDLWMSAPATFGWTCPFRRDAWPGFNWGLAPLPTKAQLSLRQLITPTLGGDFVGRSL